MTVNETRHEVETAAFYRERARRRVCVFPGRHDRRDPALMHRDGGISQRPGSLRLDDRHVLDAKVLAGRPLTRQRAGDQEPRERSEAQSTSASIIVSHRSLPHEDACMSVRTDTPCVIS